MALQRRRVQVQLLFQCSDLLMKSRVRVLKTLEFLSRQRAKGKRKRLNKGVGKKDKAEGSTVKKKSRVYLYYP